MQHTGPTCTAPLSRRCKTVQQSRLDATEPIQTEKGLTLTLTFGSFDLRVNARRDPAMDYTL